jgi:hypothetical protein
MDFWGESAYNIISFATDCRDFALLNPLEVYHG